MRPAAFRGIYDATRFYDAGEIVVMKGLIFMSKHDQNTAAPPWEAFLVVQRHHNKDWAVLDKEGPSPTKVIHRWHPQPLQYPVAGPLDNPKMSEPVDVCSDCIKEADYRNAFRPEIHLFVIPEIP